MARIPYVLLIVCWLTRLTRQQQAKTNLGSQESGRPKDGKFSAITEYESELQSHCKELEEQLSKNEQEFSVRQAAEDQKVHEAMLTVAAKAHELEDLTSNFTAGLNQGEIALASANVESTKGMDASVQETSEAFESSRKVSEFKDQLTAAQKVASLNFYVTPFVQASIAALNRTLTPGRVGKCLCSAPQMCWSRTKHACVDCSQTPLCSKECLSNRGMQLVKADCGVRRLHTQDCAWRYVLHRELSEQVAPHQSWLTSAACTLLLVCILAILGCVISQTGRFSLGTNLIWRRKRGGAMCLAVGLLICLPCSLAEEFDRCLHGVVPDQKCICGYIELEAGKGSCVGTDGHAAIVAKSSCALSTQEYAAGYRAPKNYGEDDKCVVQLGAYALKLGDDAASRVVHAGARPTAGRCLTRGGAARVAATAQCLFNGTQMLCRPGMNARCYRDGSVHEPGYYAESPFRSIQRCQQNGTDCMCGEETSMTHCLGRCDGLDCLAQVCNSSASLSECMCGGSYCNLGQVCDHHDPALGTCVDGFACALRQPHSKGDTALSLTRIGSNEACYFPSGTRLIVQGADYAVIGSGSVIVTPALESDLAAHSLAIGDTPPSYGHLPEQPLSSPQTTLTTTGGGRQAAAASLAHGEVVPPTAALPNSVRSPVVAQKLLLFEHSVSKQGYYAALVGRLKSTSSCAGFQKSSAWTAALRSAKGDGDVTSVWPNVKLDGVPCPELYLLLREDWRGSLNDRANDGASTTFADHAYGEGLTDRLTFDLICRGKEFAAEALGTTVDQIREVTSDPSDQNVVTRILQTEMRRLTHRYFRSQVRLGRIIKKGFVMCGSEGEDCLVAVFRAIVLSFPSLYERCKSSMQPDLTIGAQTGSDHLYIDAYRRITPSLDFSPPLPNPLDHPARKIDEFNECYAGRPSFPRYAVCYNTLVQDIVAVRVLGIDGNEAPVASCRYDQYEAVLDDDKSEMARSGCVLSVTEDGAVEEVPSNTMFRATYTTCAYVRAGPQKALGWSLVSVDQAYLTLEQYGGCANGPPSLPPLTVDQCLKDEHYYDRSTDNCWRLSDMMRDRAVMSTTQQWRRQVIHFVLGAAIVSAIERYLIQEYGQCGFKLLLGGLTVQASTSLALWKMARMGGHSELVSGLVGALITSLVGWVYTTADTRVVDAGIKRAEGVERFDMYAYCPLLLVFMIYVLEYQVMGFVTTNAMAWVGIGVALAGFLATILSVVGAGASVGFEGMSGRSYRNVALLFFTSLLYYSVVGTPMVVAASRENETTWFALAHAFIEMRPVCILGECVSGSPFEYEATVLARGLGICRATARFILVAGPVLLSTAAAGGHIEVIVSLIGGPISGARVLLVSGAKRRGGAVAWFALHCWVGLLVCKVHLLFMVLAAAATWVQPQRMSLHSFSQRSWIDPVTGGVASSDVPLGYPWVQMSSLLPRTGLGLSLDAVNFFLNGVEVYGDTVGPAIQNKQKKKDGGSSDDAFQMLYDIQDLQIDVAYLYDMLNELTYSTGNTLMELTPRARKAISSLNDAWGGRSFNVFRERSATAASVGTYLAKFFIGSTPEQDISTVRLEGTKSSIMNLHQLPVWARDALHLAYKAGAAYGDLAAHLDSCTLQSKGSGDFSNHGGPKGLSVNLCSGQTCARTQGDYVWMIRLLTPVICYGPPTARTFDALVEVVLESGIEATRQVTNYYPPERAADSTSFAGPGDKVPPAIFNAYHAISDGGSGNPRAVLGFGLFGGSTYEMHRDILNKYDVALLVSAELVNPAASGGPLRIPAPRSDTGDYIAGWITAGCDPDIPGSSARSLAFACTEEVLIRLRSSSDAGAASMYSNAKWLPQQGYENQQQSLTGKPAGSWKPRSGPLASGGVPRALPPPVEMKPSQIPGNRLPAIIEGEKEAAESGEPESATPNIADEAAATSSSAPPQQTLTALAGNESLNLL